MGNQKKGKRSNQRTRPLTERLAVAKVPRFLAKWSGRFADLPIGPCFASAGWREEGGLTSAIFTRKLPDRDLACVFFLVDLGCLGVKSIIAKRLARFELTQHVDGQTDRYERCAPELIAKIVEIGAEYAHNLGFQQATGFEHAARVFEGTDPAVCDETITPGKEGKPFYCAGPRDDVVSIMDHLTERLGPDGFHYLLPADLANY